MELESSFLATAPSHLSSFMYRRPVYWEVLTNVAPPSKRREYATLAAKGDEVGPFHPILLNGLRGAARGAYIWQHQGCLTFAEPWPTLQPYSLFA